MNIFKSVTLLWWQVGIVKVCLISLGIIIGSQWPTLKKYRVLWWILFILPTIYLWYRW